MSLLTALTRLMLVLSLQCLTVSLSAQDAPTEEAGVIDASMDEAESDETLEDYEAEIEPAITPDAPSMHSTALNDNTLRKLNQELDYREAPIKPKEKKSEATKAKSNDFDPRALAGIQTFLKWFFVMAAIGILVLLAYRFLKEGGFLSKGTGRKIANISINDLASIEENLYESDLDALIRHAIVQGQYRLAIRLYYLAILKELSLREMIHWKRDKTNNVYLREMRSQALFQNFQQNTQIFERIWYGAEDEQFTMQDFQQVEPTFKALLQRVMSVAV